MPRSLLYICCPPAQRRHTEQLLKAVGFLPRWAESPAAALAALEERQSVVLADYADGRTAPIVEEIRRHRPATLMLALSATGREAAREEIEAAGLPVVLHPPLQASTLSLLVSGVAARAEGWPDAAQRSFRPIFADSDGMRAALAAAALAAARGDGVLVCGESGTGRCMLAREIHERASGGDSPFVYLDCAEGTSEQVEARLFGTRASANDGPHFERVTGDSALSAAHGGSLFLANLPEASDRIQARLARVLRDEEALHGDEPHPTPLQFRPIASSDPAWDTAVAEGRVRSELAKRIAATRIEMPPLRQRREDIPQLAAYFLHRACLKRQVPLKTIDAAALALLKALPWRGNAREMAALLEDLVARSAGLTILLEDILASVRLDGSARPIRLTGTLREARLRFERDYIAAVLQQHHGRVGEAASALGIQRTNLYRKMRDLNVSWRTPPGHGRDGDPDSQ